MKSSERVSAYKDQQGNLRFRIYRKGKLIGFLSMSGLCKWMENQRLASPGKGERAKSNNRKVIELPSILAGRANGSNGGSHHEK